MSTDPFHLAPFLADGAGLFATLLGGAAGSVEQATARQVQYRPGRSITILYRVHATTSSGERIDERVVVRAGRNVPAGMEVVAADRFGNPIALCRADADPGLPALRTALDPRAVHALLVELDAAAPDENVSLRLRAHRPLRRAVVEVSTPRHRMFLKVVPPAQVASLHRRHRLLSAAGVPIAPAIGWSEDGIVALAAVPGRTVREGLASGSLLPPPQEVDAILDALPEELCELPGPADPIDRLAEHATFLRAVMPDAAPMIDDLCRGIAVVAGRVAPADDEVTAVHGDLHEAQLLTDDGGRLTGIVDVDSCGRGHRINDHATLLAHLSVLDLVVSHQRARALGQTWMCHLDRRREHHPAGLRARTASHIVGLATGPFRVQEPDWVERTVDRLELADRWLASARRALHDRAPAGLAA